MAGALCVRDTWGAYWYRIEGAYSSGNIKQEHSCRSTETLEY